MLKNFDAPKGVTFKLEHHHSSIWIVPVILACLLTPTSLISMALFHTLIELFAIIIAIMSFFVAWHTFPLSRNTTLIILGCGYFWVGGVDLLHTLSFEGLQLIPGLEVAATIQFWIIARFLEAFVLLFAAFAASKSNLSPISIMAIVTAVSLSALACQIFQWLPVMFIPGEGLTAAKIISEYTIIFLLCIAGFVFYKQRKKIGPYHARIMIMSIFFTVLAELNFTLYTGFSELPMILGHVFKLFSFWLIYCVLVESSLLMPVRSLAQIVDSYDSSSDETLIINEHGNIIRANSLVRSRLGKNCVDQHCHHVLHDTSVPIESCAQCHAIKAQHALHNFEFFNHADQEWYESSLSGIHFGNNFSAMIHSRRCISARKKSDFQLSSLNKLYRVLSQTNKAIVSVTDADTLFKQICEIAVNYGEFKMAWIGMVEGVVVRPDYYAGLETGYLKEMQMRVDDSDLAKGPVGIAAKTQRVACVNHVDTDPDFGPWRAAAQQRGYKALAAVPIKSKGKVIGIFTLYSGHEGVFDDAMLSLLTSLSDDICAAYHHIQLSIQQKESDATIRKLSSAVEQGMNAILITNAEGVIEYVNAEFVRLSEFKPADLVGKSQHSFKNAMVDEQDYQSILDALQKQTKWQGEVLNKRKDGSSYWTILSVSGIRNELDELTHILWSSIDNTQLHEAQETINKLAFYDSLTGLANRRLLKDRLDRALIAAKRHEERVAIIMCDLDNFKMINDSLGHDAGDELLKQLSYAMKSVIREDDLVARLGGDEFVIILDGIANMDEIIDIAGNLLELIEQPIELLRTKVAVSASLGITIYPEDGRYSSELLRNADLAMYHAKSRGKNSFQFYQAEMNERAMGRLRLEHRLRKAIELEQFELWYQPQVRISDSQIIGFEALIRWREGDLLVSPNEFIPLAEETGLIAALGDWVLEKAFSDWLKLLNAYPGCSMAVNVSAYQFRKSDHLYQTIQSLIENCMITKAHFIVELTESTLIQDVEATIHTLNRLKTLGVSLSIDDFGTGYSSLSRLKQFPIDQLKIDRSFIKDVLYDENDKAIVSAIIAIAQEMGLKIIAEGVELQAQADLLMSGGCYLAQGFHYYKPLMLDELLNDGKSFALINKGDT